MNKNHYCIIMAGGSGTRFWPVSRAARPKQFIDILDLGKTFIRMTFNRFAQIVPVSNIYVVTSAAYGDLTRSQLPQIPEENIILEPLKRNTAPCVAYATYKIYAQNPDAVIVVTPADHLIQGEKEFTATVSAALRYAEKHDILGTIGVAPTRPDTNYGYIQVNPRRAENFEGQRVYPVKTFTEKPNEDLAKVFLETGEFFWNSGMFIWNARTIKAELETHIPEIADLFRDYASFMGKPEEKECIARIYRDCPSISIDYAVMEKTSKARAFRAVFDWSDIGTWTSVYEHSSDKDEDGNIFKAGDLIAGDVRRSVIKETNEGKLVVVRGLEDYMVVDMEDVLMICPLKDSVIKEIVADLSVMDKTRFL
ncbi:MAG: mannose-1-phosphate guanylyltransferase [Bacteroidales bacterium]|nr:mannose-1-phosphate guanylyltransferase [Bacteroidales bacterium]